MYNPLSQKGCQPGEEDLYRRVNIEIRATLNVFNLTNFPLFAPGNNIAGNTGVVRLPSDKFRPTALIAISRTPTTGGRTWNSVSAST
jgi:hypothetical protein